MKSIVRKDTGDDWEAYETEAVLAVEVYHGDQPDGDTLEDSVNTAQGHLLEAGSQAVIEEVVADKGYHKNQTLATCRKQQLRTYICEPDGPPRRWTDKPADYQDSQRAKAAKGQKKGQVFLFWGQLKTTRPDPFVSPPTRFHRAPGCAPRHGSPGRSSINVFLTTLMAAAAS